MGQKVGEYGGDVGLWGKVRRRVHWGEGRGDVGMWGKVEKRGHGGEGGEIGET